MNRVFSHDVTAPILVSQNTETAAILVSQTNPLGVELFSYANAFFYFSKICIDAGHVSENTLLTDFAPFFLFLAFNSNSHRVVY